MSSHTVCPACGYSNSSHRVSCKSCREALPTQAEIAESLSHLSASSTEAPALSNAERRSEGARNMLVGGLWCVGGIVFTAVSYSAAGPGETYIVTWGAVLFGAAQFLKGFFQFLRDAF